MSIIKRRAELAQDIADAVECYSDNNLTEVETWDDIDDGARNILETHKQLGSLHSYFLTVGLDQSTYDKVYIEVEVMWSPNQTDPDEFILFVRESGVNNASKVAAYDKAMKVI